MEHRAQRGGTRAAASRRRGARRGAVMVEALVVIPFFIIIFASIVFIGNLYKNKLKTSQDSLAEVWLNSNLGCNGAATLSPLPGTEAVDWGEVKEAPGMALCDKEFGKLQSTKEASVKASNLIGGKNASAGTSTAVLCNEVPETGDFNGAVDFLWGLFGPEEGEIQP
ncbi:MAG: hypothetical protein IT372_21575 [Polyangiaceae bacterium]|nr:hypothetical protein [Polyangiaceae bacterium]